VAVPAATGFFFVVDLRSSLQMLKLLDGGWFPLVIGGIMFTLMMTWKQGRAAPKLRADAIDLPSFLEAVFVSPPRGWRARPCS
jgi:KUP system potassium uptake protein